MLTRYLNQFGERSGDLARIAAVCASGAILASALEMTGPIVGLRLDSHHFSATYISISTVMVPTGSVLAAIVFPGVVQRWGVRSALVAGAMMLGAMLLLLPSVLDACMIFPVGLVAGFGVGLQLLGMSYLLLRLASHKRKSTVMAFWGTCLGVANVIGSGIGDCPGIQGAVPFLLAAGLAFLVIWPYSHLPNRSADRDEKQEEKSSLSVLHAMAAAPLLILLSFCIGTGRSSIRWLLPVAGTHLGLDDGHALLLLSVSFSGGLLLAIPLGWLGDHIGRRFTVAISAGALVVVAGAVALIPGANPVLWIGSFFAGGLLAATYSLAIAGVGDLRRSVGTAGLLGAFVIAGRCGAIGGNLTAGVLIDHFGGLALFWFLATCGLVILAASTQLPPNQIRSQADEEE